MYYELGETNPKHIIGVRFIYM